MDGTQPATFSDVLDEIGGPAPLPAARTSPFLHAAEAGAALAAAQRSAWEQQPATCSEQLRTALRLARQGAVDPRSELLWALAARAFRLWAEHAAPAWANSPELRTVFLRSYVEGLV